MTIKQYAYRICVECGMQPKMAGFRYLVDCIELCYHNRNYLGMVIKGLCPEIAKRYCNSAAAIEKGCRDVLKDSKTPHTMKQFLCAAVFFIDYCEQHSNNKTSDDGLEDVLL